MSNRGWRWWLCTWNNYPEENWFDILKASGAKYGRGQKEKGESGTPHIQFVLFFPDPKSFAKAKSTLPPAVHITGKAGAAKKDICAYVWKQETAIPNSRFEWGESQTITQKSQEKYDEALQLAKDGNVLEAEAEILVKHLMNLMRLEAIYLKPLRTDACRGVWFYGKPGCGKSHAARELAGLDMYIKGQNKWFDGYRGEGSILLDDFDSASLGHLLKLWADRWECMGEIKGGTVALRHRYLIITSNYLPGDKRMWGVGSRDEDESMCAAVRRRFIFHHVESRKPESEIPIITTGKEFGEIPTEIEQITRNEDLFMVGLKSWLNK